MGWITAHIIIYLCCPIPKKYGAFLCLKYEGYDMNVSAAMKEYRLQLIKKAVEKVKAANLRKQRAEVEHRLELSKIEDDGVLL